MGANMGRRRSRSVWSSRNTEPFRVRSRDTSECVNRFEELSRRVSFASLIHHLRFAEVDVRSSCQDDDARAASAVLPIAEPLSNVRPIG